MSTRKFNQKSIRIHIKRGGTTSGLMSKYGFDSADEMYDSLLHVFPEWAPGVISELRKNDKNEQKHSQKKKFLIPAAIDDTVIPEEVEANIIYDEQDLASSTEEYAEPTQTVRNDMPADDTNVETTTLDALLEEEKKLSDLVFNLEGIHKNLMSDRIDCIHELQSCQSAAIELQRLIQANREHVSVTIKKYDALANEMSKISTEIRFYRTTLEEVRERIFIAKKVFIYVFCDSSIEVENADIPSSLEICDISSLIQRPEAEELTIRELKAVAKLISITKWLESQNIPFELSFDSVKVQTLFKAVMV